MKRRSTAGAVTGMLCTLGLVLAGCGAGSRTGASTATETACDFQAPAQATTVNVLAYNSSAIDPFTNTMVKSCTRDTVTVRHEPIDFAGQVQRTQATLGSAQGTYDIIETYGFVIPGFAEQDQIQPLDDYVAKYQDQYGLGGLNDAMLERMSYEGKLYALPMQAQTLTLAYRKDVFDKLGIATPTTWDEIKDAATQIQESGDMQYPLALPYLSSGDLGTAYVAMLGAYGKPYVDPETKEPNFDSEESRQALETMKSLMPFMDPQVITFDQPRVQQQMYNGSAAMSIMFSGRMNDLTNAQNSQFADQFAFAAPPAAKEGGKLYTQVSIDGWSIPNNTQVDPELLFQMMAASVSEDASRAAVPAAYPAREGMVDPQQVPYATAVDEAIAGAPDAQPYPWVAQISNDTLPVVAQVVTGDTSVEDGMAQMQSIAQDVMKQY